VIIALFQKNQATIAHSLIFSPFSTVPEIKEKKNIVRFTKQVTKEVADKINHHWQKIYQDPGTYHFLWRQCTTTVADSLEKAGLGVFDAILPMTLVSELQDAGWKKS